MLKNLQQMHLKTSSKTLIQKAAEAIGDLISNKTANVVSRRTVKVKLAQKNFKTFKKFTRR